MTAPRSPAWTDEQAAAIETAGTDLLVSAGAGAGKTAVLVERIVRRVTDPVSPIDVDKLLVVTFTEAAALEMRQRIARSLAARLESDPLNRRLHRQLTLLGRASISTLHAFCHRILRQYFYRIDLDPTFRVLDEHETDLLRLDTLDVLFEARYAASAADGDFYDLVARYGGERGDERLRAVVLQLHRHAASLPNPGAWLERAMQRFAAADRGGADVWFAELRQEAAAVLRQAAALTATAWHVAARPQGPAGYATALQTAQALFLELADAAWPPPLEQAGAAGWDALQGRLAAVLADLPRLGKAGPRHAEVDEVLQEAAKKAYGRSRELARSLRTGVFARSAADHIAELRQLAEPMRALVELTLAFGEAFAAAKRQRNAIDYADMEQLCLQLLQAAPGGSQLALELQERFAEVLVDEYQDINPVQDALLRGLARPGRLFMVGDVKQSIYGFRLAEPGLFLQRYASFAPVAVRGGLGGGEPLGQRVDLSANFRSRADVIDGINFLFRQLMTPGLSGLAYDEAAELVAQPDPPGEQPVEAPAPRVEVHWVEREPDQAPSPASSEPPEVDGEEAEETEASDLAKLEAQAAVIGQRIRALVPGDRRHPPASVWDAALGALRPARLGDIAILLRSPKASANALVETLGRMGVPAYCQSATGYFQAIEVQTMLALLRVIDNPRQDIPLAAVLRSPIVNLKPEELARIRLDHPRGDFYQAARETAETAAPTPGGPGRHPAAAHAAAPRSEHPVSPELPRRLADFFEQLDAWRTAARQGPLSRLIWRIYRETGYAAFVAGMPGGAQREANLRALYDRACQFDQFTRQGLFRFLRFIDRLQANEKDLGVAPGHGENEDVVRVMSVHKSKGLEFSIVFLADVDRQFNLVSAHGDVLIDRELGLGPAVALPDTGLVYPSLAQAAVHWRIRRQTLAEELRLLYVALTRARERLIIVGSGKRVAERWQSALEAGGRPGWPLPEWQLMSASAPADWLIPALARHPDAASARLISPDGEVWGSPLFAEAASVGEAGGRAPDPASQDPSRWAISIWSPAGAAAALAEASRPESAAAAPVDWGAVAALRPGAAQALFPADVSWDETERAVEAMIARVRWRSPWQALAHKYAKLTVTELTHRLDWQRDPDESPDPVLPGLSAGQAPAWRRPRFVQEGPGSSGLLPAEVGTAVHLVLQHLALDGPLGEAGVTRQIGGMVERELLTPEEAAAIDAGRIAAFFASPLGQRLLAQRASARREVPFSLALPASEVYPDLPPTVVENERVLVQGMIDCLFPEPAARGGVEYVLIDFKTDRVSAAAVRDAAARYAGQIRLYRRAVELSDKQPVRAAYLYFLHPGCALEMGGGRAGMA